MNLLDELRYQKALEALEVSTVCPSCCHRGWKYSGNINPLPPVLQGSALVNIVPVFLLLLFSSLLPAVVYLSEHLIGHWTKWVWQEIFMDHSSVSLSSLNFKGKPWNTNSFDGHIKNVDWQKLGQCDGAVISSLEKHAMVSKIMFENKEHGSIVAIKLCK